MNHKASLLTLSALSLATGMYFSQQMTDPPVFTPPAQPTGQNFPQTPATAPTDNQGAKTSTDLLTNPTVLTYLEHEQDKQRIHDFFSGQGEDNPEDIWALIETIEREGRVLGFEALHLKLAWLEKQSVDKEAFEAAAKPLLDDYKQRAAASAQAYRPEDIPGYTDYKARELAIIKEVNGMSQFPEGLSHAEYLRQRLLEARLDAYGEAR